MIGRASRSESPSAFLKLGEGLGFFLGVSELGTFACMLVAAVDASGESDVWAFVFAARAEVVCVAVSLWDALDWLTSMSLYLGGRWLAHVW